MRDKLWPDWLGYVAVIEGPDGYTYEQPYTDYEYLVELLDALGEGYRIVCVY